MLDSWYDSKFGGVLRLICSHQWPFFLDCDSLCAVIVLAEVARSTEASGQRMHHSGVGVVGGSNSVSRCGETRPARPFNLTQMQLLVQAGGRTWSDMVTTSPQDTVLSLSSRESTTTVL